MLERNELYRRCTCVKMLWTKIFWFCNSFFSVKTYHSVHTLCTHEKLCWIINSFIYVNNNMNLKQQVIFKSNQVNEVFWEVKCFRSKKKNSCHTISKAQWFRFNRLWLIKNLLKRVNKTTVTMATTTTPLIVKVKKEMPSDEIKVSIWF